MSTVHETAIDRHAAEWFANGSEDDDYRDAVERAAKAGPLAEDAKELLAVRDRFNAYFDSGALVSETQLHALVARVIREEAQTYGACVAFAAGEATETDARRVMRECIVAYRRGAMQGLPTTTGGGVVKAALLALLLVACGGTVDATPPTSCNVANDGSGVVGPFACGADNLFWKWTDDNGIEHMCDESPCSVGSTCDLHAHLGVCQ